MCVCVCVFLCDRLTDIRIHPSVKYIVTLNQTYCSEYLGMVSGHVAHHLAVIGSVITASILVSACVTPQSYYTLFSPDTDLKGPYR